MSVQAADPRRMRPGDTVAVLSLGVDGTVASVSREDDVWRVNLGGGGALEAVDGGDPSWRFVHPDGTLTDVPAEEVLHQAVRVELDRGSAAERSGAGVPTVWKLAAAFVLVTMFGVACGVPSVTTLACYGLLRAWPLEKGSVEVMIDEVAVLEQEVEEGQVMAVWLELELQAPTEAWSLDGTLTIDGLAFPVTLAPGIEPIAGLPADWADQLHRKADPEGAILRRTLLLGAIPPGAPRVVRTELILHAHGASVRELRLSLKD